MEETIDITENNENVLDLENQNFQDDALLSRYGVVVFFILFVSLFASTLFIFKNTEDGGAFAKEDESTQNIQNASVFDIPIIEEEDEIIPVKVVLYKDPFENIKLEAQSVYVLDTVTGKTLYERNKNTRRPLASLTKAMTALVATEVIRSNDLVSITALDVKEEGNSGLLLGEKWKFSNLLDFTLMTSSNDGASAIASVAGAFSVKKGTTTIPQNPKEIFVEKMNEQAEELNLTRMEFFNESGLDLNDTQSGAYGTAEEVAALFEYILKNNPDLMEATVYETLDFNSQNSITHTAKNTNEFVESYPGLLMSKTGYTNLAGGNLAVAFDSGIGTPVIIVVLGSTIDGRFEDVMKLYEASLEEINQGMY